MRRDTTLTIVRRDTWDADRFPNLYHRLLYCFFLAAATMYELPQVSTPPPSISFMPVDIPISPHPKEHGYYPTTEQTIQKSGRWLDEEHKLFLQGIETYGREWKMVQKMIPTRTVVQIRTHAQKYFKRLEKEKEQKMIQKLKHEIPCPIEILDGDECLSWIDTSCDIFTDEEIRRVIEGVEMPSLPVFDGRPLFLRGSCSK